MPDARLTRACAHKHLMSAFDGKADIDRDVPRWCLTQCAHSVVMIGATQAIIEFHSAALKSLL